MGREGAKHRQEVHAKYGITVIVARLFVIWELVSSVFVLTHFVLTVTRVSLREPQDLGYHRQAGRHTLGKGAGPRTMLLLVIVNVDTNILATVLSLRWHEVVIRWDEVASGSPRIPAIGGTSVVGPITWIVARSWRTRIASTI